MRAAVITRFGPPEVLELRDWPDPEPGPGEVRIRARFAGVNFADTSARLGLYRHAPPAPCVVGYEVSGVVDAFGPDVGSEHGLTVGDRVLALTRFGGYGELVCTDVHGVRRIPDGTSEEEAAALPVVYLTAYHMLHHLTTVRRGDRVLIHAAAGGVGIAAIQMCRAVGAEIYGTASPSKHEFLQGLGVAHCIDYRSRDFAEEVLSLTAGEGVDIVLDALGGSALAKSYRVLRPGGRLFTFGFSAATPGVRRALFTIVSQFMRMPRFNPLKLMEENRSVLGVDMNSMSRRTDLMSAELDGVLALLQAREVRPHIDKVFPLSEAAAAHRYLQERRNIGKVLLAAP